jgi:hypothetical protein
MEGAAAATGEGVGIRCIEASLRIIDAAFTQPGYVYVLGGAV